MRSDWLVLGDVWNQTGLYVLMCDLVADSINDLPKDALLTFSTDKLAADALRAVTHANWINHDLLGNRDTQLHSHSTKRLRVAVHLADAPPVFGSLALLPLISRAL